MLGKSDDNLGQKAVRISTPSSPYKMLGSLENYPCFEYLRWNLKYELDSFLCPPLTSMHELWFWGGGVPLFWNPPPPNGGEVCPPGSPPPPW